VNLCGTIVGGGTWWSAFSTGLGDKEGEQVDEVDIGLYCPELLPFEEPFEELQAPV